MYKFKQSIIIFIMIILSVSYLKANTHKFYGTVILPESITSLLDTCDTEACPSINIYFHEELSDGLSSSNGGQVDYNKTSAKYEYIFNLMNNKTPESMHHYEMYIWITHGNMGNELLYYSFGSDNAVGSTGNHTSEDSVLHEDERYSSQGVNLIENLYLEKDEISTEINIDLSDKDIGRQKIIAEVTLPSDIVLGYIYDNFGYEIGYNHMGIFISDRNLSQYGWATVNSFPDPSGLYHIIGSISNDKNIDLNLSLVFYADIDAHYIATSYQIGSDILDVDDHSIDGDEKLVTNRLNPLSNYVTFNTEELDFGRLDFDRYYSTMKSLRGTFISPKSFSIDGDNNGSNSIHLSFYSKDTKFWFNSNIVFNKYNENIGEPSHGVYQYEVLIAEDIESLLNDSNLSLNIIFSSHNYISNTYDYRVAYYSFERERIVNGLDSGHILEGSCINRDDAKPLSLDFSKELPIVDINISDYLFPITTKVEVALDIPNTISYLYMNSVNLSCDMDYFGYSGNHYNEDTTVTLSQIGFQEGNDYGFEFYYETGSYLDGSNIWHSYVLNDDDGDFTNGGSFLDTLVQDEDTGFSTFEHTYIATDSDVVFSKFDLITPVVKSEIESIIMYLLN